MQRAVLTSASGSLSPKRSFEAFPQISRESNDVYVKRRQEQETKEHTHETLLERAGGRDSKKTQPRSHDPQKLIENVAQNDGDDMGCGND
jgi:hypothetical protein